MTVIKDVRCKLTQLASEWKGLQLGARPPGGKTVGPMEAQVRSGQGHLSSVYIHDYGYSEVMYQQGPINNFHWVIMIANYKEPVIIPFPVSMLMSY